MRLLAVPYSEKDQVKALGAKYDYIHRVWYVPNGLMLEPFECWLPDGAPGGNVRKVRIKPAKLFKRGGKA